MFFFYFDGSYRPSRLCLHNCSRADVASFEPPSSSATPLTRPLPQQASTAKIDTSLKHLLLLDVSAVKQAKVVPGVVQKLRK